MESHTATTLATLRETLRITRAVRETELLAGNHEMVATEDRAIARLEERIAQIEARAQRIATRNDK